MTTNHANEILRLCDEALREVEEHPVAVFLSLDDGEGGWEEHLVARKQNVDEGIRHAKGLAVATGEWTRLVI